MIQRLTSSKTRVVKVDAKGVLTAVSPRTAMIKVQTKKGTVSCKITVKNAIAFESLKLYEKGKAGKITPKKKGTTKLTVKVRSSNATTKTYTKSYKVATDQAFRMVMIDGCIRTLIRDADSAVEEAVKDPVDTSKVEKAIHQ